MSEIPQSVQTVLKTLEMAGHQAWCVGGCVRDLRLGRFPEDWDVTTDALPEDTLSLFGGQALPTGLSHGTVTVRTECGGVEVTTFRQDGAYRDHRRPECVVFTDSLEQDLLRRDFTINAMAMDRRGCFRDPFGGAADLERGLLRCVGDPAQRFREDALRMMRGLRFAAVLGLTIHPATGMALHQCRTLLGEIAPERIWTELGKLLRGERAAEILREYPDVLGVFWPELLPMVGFDQKNCHHCYDVWEHTLHAVDAAPPDLILRCTLLLHDIGKPKSFTVDDAGIGHFCGHPAVSRELAADMLCRLRVDRETFSTVTCLVAFHDRPIAQTDRSVRRALQRLGEKNLRRLITVKRADNLAQDPAFWNRQRDLDGVEGILDRLLAEDACFSLKRLAVKGKDLIDIGYAGPAIGAMLTELLNGVVDGELDNDRAHLLKYAQKKR